MRPHIFLIVAVCCAFCGTVQAAPPPVVMYHFPTPWDGRPSNPAATGWHVLASGPLLRGADTGVMAFLSKWDASRQCWGSQRDCRPPSWAMQHGLSYIGPVNADPGSIFQEIRQ